MAPKWGFARWGGTGGDSVGWWGPVLLLAEGKAGQGMWGHGGAQQHGDMETWRSTEIWGHGDVEGAQ